MLARSLTGGIGVGTPRSRIAQIWKMLLITAKWTVGILFVLILLLVAINAIDEDLTPEAKALLIAPPNPNKPENNLYLSLLGIDAPEKIFPIAAGQARVAAHEEEVAAALKDPRYVFQDLTGTKRAKLEFQGKMAFCRPLQESCVTNVEAHKAEAERLLKANRVLHQRYLSLHRATGYYETATPSTNVLLAYAPQPVRQLFLANIALHIKTGTLAQQQSALADLHSDIRTWRLMLTGDGLLISKMLAVANLHGDYAVLADIMADRKFDLNRHSSAIRAMLDLLVQDDWKIGKVFAYEYRLSEFLWEQMRSARASGVSMSNDPSRVDQERWKPYLEKLLDPFLKLNATRNLHARVMLQRQKVADADPKEYLAARDAYLNWRREKVDLGAHFVYNPIGKSILVIAEDAFDEYPLRAFDAAAFHRLVRLAFEIRSRKIEGKAVPSFMQRHPQWATHPVDGRPFIWDETKHEIAVQPLAKQPKDRRFSIPVRTTASYNK
jgi:hypothetical protein